MKYDVFMRTRTFDRDYDWVNKPDYISANTFGACKSIIALCENPMFGELSVEDWYGNFYYLRMEECCVLARVARTQYATPDGQSIISFEGVAVKKENERRLFHNIPNLINELLPPSKSFRAVFEEDGAMPVETGFENHINPFDLNNVPDDIHPDIKNNQAFRNLMSFTAFADKPAGFVFGRNARAFSALVERDELGLFHIFDFDNPDSVTVNENGLTDSYTPVTCDYKQPIATGEDKVAIQLLVKETGDNSYRYRWEAKPWDSSVSEHNRARFISPYYDIGDRVGLAKLELQKEALKQFLIDKGWKKGQFGLRFVRDTFKREGN
ncbi:MAG: hypothetical protein FWF82_01790 [Oscillospiraceae bacterium]|nr:hypothetical protein [Oscillospiraceae bacterium]